MTWSVYIAAILPNIGSSKRGRKHIELDVSTAASSGILVALTYCLWRAVHGGKIDERV